MRAISSAGMKACWGEEIMSGCRSLRWVGTITQISAELTKKLNAVKLASRHSTERAQNRQETARRLLHCISSGQHTTAAHYHQAGSTCLCPTTVLQLHNRYPQQLHGKIRPWLLSTWHLVQQSDSSVLCEGLLHSDTKENHSDRFPGSGMLKALRHTSWLCIKGAWRYLNAHAFISTLLVK